MVLSNDSKKMIDFFKKVKYRKNFVIKNINNTNISKIVNYLIEKYNNFNTEKLNLINKNDKILEEEIFLNNLDTCSGNKKNYLLNIQKILIILNKDENKHILDKMLKLHKYDIKQIQNIYKFINQVEVYENKYIIDWINQNGIELMRSLYIFLLNKRLPKEVYQILGSNYEIYGEFTSVDIQGEIELGLKNIYKRKYLLNNTELNIVLYTNQKIEKNESYFQNFIKRCFFLSYILNDSKSINYKLWLSSIKKYLPKKLNLSLGPKEVNSGCTNGIEISLWRKEEISKILIHEIMHYLYLERIPDIDIIRNYIYNKFDININVNINFFESYAEFWTNILNITFIIMSNKNNVILKKSKRKTGTLKKNKSVKNNKKNIDEIIKLLNIEITFSLFQCAKVLNYFNYNSFNEFYNYNGYLKKTDRFKQRSNVFSYYIARSLLLFNIEKMISLCYKYNLDNVIKNNIPANEFINVMEDTINNTNFISVIDNLIKDNKTMKNKFIKNTMRFTCVEQKYKF